jgi:hypothetical protein
VFTHNLARRVVSVANCDINVRLHLHIIGSIRNVSTLALTPGALISSSYSLIATCSLDLSLVIVVIIMLMSF